MLVSTLALDLFSLISFSLYSIAIYYCISNRATAKVYLIANLTMLMINMANIWPAMLINGVDMDCNPRIILFSIVHNIMSSLAVGLLRYAYFFFVINLIMTVVYVVVGTYIITSITYSLRNNDFAYLMPYALYLYTSLIAYACFAVRKGTALKACPTTRPEGV
jgi:hypothetical protein